MKFMVDRKPLWMGYGFEVRIMSEAYDGRPVRVGSQHYVSPCYVSELVVKTIPFNEMARPVPPAIELSEEQAQQLCDALWEAGVRPTNGAGSVGQLAATERHLSDLKTIAFNALKITAGERK